MGYPLSKKIIKDLDIFDVNMVFQMQIESPPKREKSWVKIVRNKLFSLIKLLFPQNTRKNVITKGKVVFYGASSNNRNAFRSILDNLDSKEYITIWGEEDFPLVKALYLSIPFTFRFLKKFWKGTSSQRKLIWHYPLQYLFTYGKFIIANRIIEMYQPKLLVLANDHSPMNRCLILLSNFSKIKTLYIQHAPVSDKFPKLTFDYALLDGEESFEKYKCTSKHPSKILLTGGARYDSFYLPQKKSHKKKIGISINQFDDFEIVKNLILNIKNKTDYLIAVRPHPNMIDWNRSWFEKNGIEYSDSTINSPSFYLKSLWIQISNVCGIHLDAVILGIPTVQFQFSKEQIFDQYGFFRKGLIKKARDFTELEYYFNDSQKLIPPENIIKYFMASYKTSMEGRVGQFTADYILAILKGKRYEREIEENYKLKVFQF